MPTLPKNSVWVRPSVAVDFLIGMRLEGFEYVGREQDPTQPY